MPMPPRAMIEAMFAKLPQQTAAGFAVIEDGKIQVNTISETPLDAMTTYLNAPPWPMDVPAAFDETSAHLVAVTIKIEGPAQPGRPDPPQPGVL